MHGKVLAKAWNDIQAEDLYTPRANVNDDGTGSIWLIKNKSIPSSYALELGEMLYQLRSTLDASVYEAAIFETGKNPPPDEHNLEFPICASRDEFNKKAAIKLRPLAYKRWAIIESVQPYNVPKLTPEELAVSINRTLGLLNDWARIDRHRRLHIVGSWLSRIAPELRLPPEVQLVSMEIIRHDFLGNKNEIAKFRLAGYTRGMTLQVNPYAAVQVAVNESPSRCAENDTFDHRLVEMLNTVNSIVLALEESF